MAWAVGVVAVVAGCAGTPQQPTPRSEDEDPVAAAIASAESATAARERAQAYLAALLELVDRGDFQRAARIHDLLVGVEATNQPILADALTQRERFEVDAAALNIALAAGDDGLARRLSAALRPATVQQHSAAARLHVRALADFHDHEQAALALIALAVERGADNGDLAPVAAAAWRHLSRLPPPVLERLAESLPTADAKAWLRLAHRYNTALTSAAQRRIWRAWQDVNPHHVAVRFPPPSVAELPPPVRRLALLIPLSGDLAPLAEAVRDGFLAAHLHAAQDDPAPTVRIYDTGTASVANAYRRALEDGADVVVGPLDKAAVGELARLSPQLPVVALNSLDDDAPAEDATFPQLSLAVEETAAAIAARLAADGVQRVAIFESARPGSWASRARARFEADLDDVAVVAVGMLSGVAEATQVAGATLGIAASTERHASLSRRLRASLEFAPSRRDDVDALVTFVEGVELRALKPALDFHYAGDMPTYAPSQAVRDGAWAGFEGLRVCDIPWRLYESDLRRETVDLASSRGALAAVFALGVDGFRVANQLFRFVSHGESIAGSTGQLTLGANGRIRRELAWGQVTGERLVATKRKSQPMKPRALFQQNSTLEDDAWRASAR